MMSLIKSFNDIIYTIQRKYKLKTFFIIISLAIIFDIILFTTWVIYIYFDLAFIHPLELKDFTDGK